MTFASIRNGSQLFIDANIFVYHATADAKFGASCKELVERIARQEIVAVTSAAVLSEVAHRVMTIEAMAQFGWPVKGIAVRLRQNPDDVRKLALFRQSLLEIPRYGVSILPISFDLIEAAAEVSQLYGLLSNDALIVAVMHAHGLTDLASNDPDFDRVPGIGRYAAG